MNTTYERKKAIALIEEIQSSFNISVYDSVVSLKNEQLKILVSWKLAGKKVPSTKKYLLVAWNTNKHTTINITSLWSTEKENLLATLTTTSVMLHNTELGRQAKAMAQKFEST